MFYETKKILWSKKMNLIVNILWVVLSSETFKTLIKKATRKIVETKGVSLDPEISRALILDISESNGNNLGKDLAITMIKEL